VKSFAHFAVLYMLLIKCIIITRSFSPKN
jgi:hypothetical protein